MVIGAGVIGLAVARELASAGRQVLVLERHTRPGTETSSRNSEVIHAGMYYPPGSLKARLCVAANPELHRWCEARGVPHRRIGKFIVATSADEQPELERLLERGRANGVPGLRLASRKELKREEPDLRAVTALWSPDTGIVDSHRLLRSLEQDAVAEGCSFAYGHRWRRSEPCSGGYDVCCVDPTGRDVRIRARTVVNAAGLDADVVAAAMGIDVEAAGYRQIFVKGSYFRLREGAAVRPRHLIYPVPHPVLAGLGVHVTVDMAGGVRLGPDIEFLNDRIIDYSVAPELAAVFAERASRYLPELQESDLRPDQSGIRPRRFLKDGGVPDFVIAEETNKGLPGWVNLIGMESPGLTCCLGIGREVGRLLGG